jgi:hypothetical protein
MVKSSQFLKVLVVSEILGGKMSVRKEGTELLTTLYIKQTHLLFRHGYISFSHPVSKYKESLLA